jgi:hypothetical protein
MAYFCGPSTFATNLKNPLHPTEGPSMSKAFHPSTFLSAGCAALCLLAAPRPASAGELDGFIKSFEDNTDYIQPFATIFGTATNSGWYQSAGVGKGFGFYFGIPISLTYLADADRTYSGSYTDQGCVTAHSKNPSAACQEATSFTAPTAFGRIKAPTLHKTTPDINGNPVAPGTDSALSDGLGELSAFNILPFAEPQLSFNFYHTELKLRYIGLPIPHFSFSMPGIGIQHDISSFAPIPFPGVHASVAGNMTWLSAEFEPGGNIDGTLEMDGYSYFFGVLAGYTLMGWGEVFLETGWEGAHMHSGGNLILKDSGDPAKDEVVKPNLNVDGRNGFRASLSVAIHFGYQAVISQGAGAELSQNVNILGYRF